MATPQQYRLPSINELVGAIEEAFPGLAGYILPLTFLGEGYEFAVFESSNGYVFRFPKREDAARKQIVENSLLPELGATLPVEVPLPLLLAAPSPICPWGFHGYLKLSGVAVANLQHFEESLPRLAPQIAGFLAALHSFPADRALALSVPDNSSWFGDFSEMHQLLLVELESRLTPIELDKMDEWWQAFLRIAERWSFRPVLTHSDFGPDHVLIQPETLKVSGVIDFGDVVLGDPALDFAGLLALGNEDFMLDVTRAYHEMGGPADSGVVDRARLLRKRNVFLDVVHALTLGHLGPPIPTIEHAMSWLRAGLPLLENP